MAGERQIAGREKLARGRRHAVVYYATGGEQHPSSDYIKIGTTGDLQLRLAKLGVTLIATEPGSFDIERHRHIQFAHLRVAGEWFKPGADLLAHIERLAS